MFKKGNRIFIAHSADLSHLLEVIVYHLDDKDRVHFDVNDGCWTGYYDLDQSFVYVKETREKVPAILACIDQSVKNIEEAKEHIKLHGYPKIERKKEKDEIFKMRTTIRLSLKRYLVIDKENSEIRLFEKRNGKNIFIRSMSLET